MTPQNITKICKRFGRHAFHFCDNIDPLTQKPFSETKNAIQTKKGRGACTEITDERVLYEFLLWLSPETRGLLQSKGVEETLEFAKRYR